MHNPFFLVGLAACLCLVGCGGPSVPAAAGTYELDRVALAAALTDEILGNAPEAVRQDAATIAEAKATATEQAAAMSLTLVLNADGTSVSTGDMAGSRFTSKGTWTLDGSKLTLTTTEQDGEKDETPETNVATLEGKVLSIQPEGAPWKFVLTRK
jgi:hypothetical protein